MVSGRDLAVRLRSGFGLAAVLPAGAFLLMAAATDALAACPMELAVYSEPETGAGIDFRPGQTGVVSNAFRMHLGRGLLLDGVVMWSDEVPRPVGMLMNDCPEGDVTGAEIEACTMWQGVIYTADHMGNIGTLPAEGEDAPATIILADLGRSLRHAPSYDAGRLPIVPGDVFSLSGCQE